MSGWVEPRIRKFRPSDCAIGGRTITWPHNGLTAEIDGRPAVVAGVHRWHGQLWLFFQVLDERARRPVFLHRRAKALLQSLKGCGEAIYVHRDPAEPSSARWLTRLGFMRTPYKHLGLEVWQRWQP